MRRLKVLVLACLAVGMLAAVMVEAASAASALPEFTTATAGTATTGEGTLALEGTKVTCKKGADTFGAGKTSGTFTLGFKECKSAGKECKGLAQAAELIELTGEWHLVSQKANRKSYDIWFLLASSDGTSAVHIECASPVGTLILTWGNVLGSIEAITERTFKINVETSGEAQKITEFGNNSGASVTAGLKGKLDGGTERSAFEESKENLLFSNAATKISET